MLILTVSVLAMIVSVLAMGVAVTASTRSAQHVDKLSRMRLTIDILDASNIATQARIRKLEGKFYGTLGARQADAEQKAEEQEAARHILECENWFIAKKDGPLSKAAKCECAYCVSMRTAREAARKALVPGYVNRTLNGPKS